MLIIACMPNKMTNNSTVLVKTEADIYVGFKAYTYCSRTNILFCFVNTVGQEGLAMYLPTLLNNASNHGPFKVASQDKEG